MKNLQIVDAAFKELKHKSYPNNTNKNKNI
jgi:hypothetical protein